MDDLRALDVEIARALGYEVRHDMGGLLADEGVWHSIPAYSTDPGAAAELRREMEEREWGWTLAGCTIGVSCIFRKRGAHGEAIEDTEPLATARAALAALQAGA